MRPLVLAALLALAPLAAAQAGSEPGGREPAGQAPGARAADGEVTGRQVFEDREPAVAGAVHVKGVAARGVVIHAVESRTVEPRAGGEGRDAARDAEAAGAPGAPRAR